MMQSLTQTLPLVQESNSLSTCLWLLEYMYIAKGFVLKQKEIIQTEELNSV